MIILVHVNLFVLYSNCKQTNIYNYSCCTHRLRFIELENVQYYGMYEHEWSIDRARHSITRGNEKF
jgi:hypothetical protein